MKPKLTFVQISDSHLGPAPDFEKHGVRPFDCLNRVVTLINEFPEPPDFVIHTGAVSNDRSAESYECAVELLSRLEVPVYYVNGNHDRPATLRRMMDPSIVAQDDPDAPLSYTFDLKGERFVVLDAFSTQVEQPQGYLTEDQLAFLRAETESDGPPLTVFVHYPPFAMGSPWLDRNMPITNGEALHRALLPARDRLHGVFGGHLHRPCQTIRDGISYRTAASVAFQYAWQAWDDKPYPDLNYPPGYTVVRYLDDYVVATDYTF